MARPRKTAPEGTPPTGTHPGPSRVFARRSAGDRSALTHETIAADMDAFHQAGGTIEVLGTTHTLRKIGQDGKATAPPAPIGTAPAKPRR